MLAYEAARRAARPRFGKIRPKDTHSCGYTNRAFCRTLGTQTPSGGKAVTVEPFFNVVLVLNIALPLISLVSVIMVTIALLRMSSAQQSMARSMEALARSLREKGQ